MVMFWSGPTSCSLDCVLEQAVFVHGDTRTRARERTGVWKLSAHLQASWPVHCARKSTSRAHEPLLEVRPAGCEVYLGLFHQNLLEEPQASLQLDNCLPGNTLLSDGPRENAGRPGSFRNLLCGLVVCSNVYCLCGHSTG